MDFYYKLSSSACRAVMMTAEAIGVNLNLKCVDFYKKSNCALELLKINPQFNIPTFVDGELILTESRAIMTYLVESYASTDSLYPKCNKKRAEVNQFLFFDLIFLYQPFKEFSLMRINGRNQNSNFTKTKLMDGLDMLDSLLVSKTFLTGDHMTLADLSLYATVSSCLATGVVIENLSNVKEWYIIMNKEAPGNCINTKGSNALTAFFKNFT